MTEQGPSDFRTVVINPAILDVVLERFRTETGKTNLGIFLGWLVDKGALGPEQDKFADIDPEIAARTECTDPKTWTAGLKMRLVTALYDRFHRETGKQNPTELEEWLEAKALVNETVFAGRTIPMAGGTAVPASAKPTDTGHDLLGVIGEGGMGQVRRARDRALRRDVAIKRLKTDLMSPQLVAQFRTEAQLTAQLDHPNITPVYALTSDVEGDISFSMKLIQGKTLEELIAEAQAEHDAGEVVTTDDEHSLNTLLDHFLKACDAMSSAHSKDVLHCDLKPANIMIGAFREVCVMDWGLARVMEHDDSHAQHRVDLGAEERAATATVALDGAVSGTVLYMSPEQASGRNSEMDERSDIYSLGMILYEITTLKLGVSGKSMHDMLSNVAEGRREPVEHRIAGTRIASELRAIINKATAFKPEDRYQTVDELSADVRRFLAGEAVMARPDNFLQKTLRLMARHRMLTLCLVLGIVALSGVATTWSLYKQMSALEASRFREQRITAYVADVGTRSQRVDRQFLRLETMLRGLTRSAGQLLTAGKVSKEPLYSHDLYGPGGTLPPDTVNSPLYRRHVNVDWPVYKLAPGVKLRTVERKVRQLMGLRRTFQSLLVNSRVSAGRVPAGDVRNLLTVRGVPIRWAYFGLAEGVMFSYPGKGPYPDEYDPRVRPWYKLGWSTNEPVWGNPYIDLQGQGLILPCVASFRDETGRFAGVAGIEVTFDDLIGAFMKPGKKAVVNETALLDKRGRVVISSKQLGKTYAGGKLHSALKLAPYPVKAMIRAIRRGETGHVETVRDGETVIITYHHIPTLGWAYVEERGLADLLKR